MLRGHNVRHRGTIGTQSSIHLVITGAWHCVGLALGLHVGTCHCSRCGAWSTSWHPTKSVGYQIKPYLIVVGGTMRCLSPLLTRCLTLTIKGKSPCDSSPRLSTGVVGI